MKDIILPLPVPFRWLYRWGGVGCADPLEYHKAVDLLRNTAMDPPPPPWKITKLPIAASIQGWAIIGPPVKRHLNGISLVGQWWPAFFTGIDFLSYTSTDSLSLLQNKLSTSKLWTWTPYIHICTLSKNSKRRSDKIQILIKVILIFWT